MDLGIKSSRLESLEYSFFTVHVPWSAQEPSCCRIRIGQHWAHFRTIKQRQSLKDATHQLHLFVRGDGTSASPKAYINAYFLQRPYPQCDRTWSFQHCSHFNSYQNTSLSPDSPKPTSPVTISRSGIFLFCAPPYLHSKKKKRTADQDPHPSARQSLKSHYTPPPFPLRLPAPPRK